MARDRGHDPLVGVEVDPERLLAEQVAAGLEDRHVQLGVQVVGDRAVDGLDVGVVEQVAPVGGRPWLRLQPLVPGQDVRVGVAHMHDLRPDVEVGEVQPARGGGRELAAHQAAADDAEADGPRKATDVRSVDVVTFVDCPWTISISLRVIPAGSACWMTLRP